MRVRRGAAVALAGVVASAVACGSGENVARRTTTSHATTTSTLTTAPSTSVQTSTTTSTTAAAATPAYDQLAAFITAARKFDAQLKVAAKAINATGPPWHSITPAVAAAVSAADLNHLGATLPAGMPPALLQKTLVVYSELYSRRQAMADFAYPFTFVDFSDAFYTQQQAWFLQALPNGHEAAVRFPRDLVALENAARATAPFPVPAPTSRAQAELLLIRSYVETVEAGCDSRGGVIVETVPRIEWRSFESDGQHRDGLIEGIQFNADLVAGAWKVNLNAC